ncbi:MAG: hypothetical protein MJ025_03005 [Victivallaceae bacterium]|nr:hypothetical protein [Victivallaceae bacterium]
MTINLLSLIATTALVVLSGCSARRGNAVPSSGDAAAIENQSRPAAARVLPKNTAGHFYDFGKEREIGNWRIVSRDGERYRAETVLSGFRGHKVIAVPAEPILGYHWIIPHALFINGERFDLGSSATPNYSWPHASRYGLRHFFDGADVKLAFEFDSAEKSPLDFVHVAVLDDLEPVAPPEKVDFTFHGRVDDIVLPDPETSDVSGMSTGITSEGRAGRFGFVKGDGLLDFAMPYLGVVDKMYICGLPEYQKPFRWTFRMLPPGMPLHGDFPVATAGTADDRIEVNRLSVLWEAKNGPDTFSCRYSIASPGVIVHDSRGSLRLSDLEYAGNYQYVLIPGKDGARIHTLESVDDLDMAANYLLFFGSTEFPDVPLMVVLKRQPKSLSVLRDSRTGRLTEIVFGGVQDAIVATPFGIECFQPISPRDENFLCEALRRCRFWHRALLAMPVSVKEYYRIDRDRREVAITEKFEYFRFQDEWGTVPLETAPLPPVLFHCGTARHRGAALGFPTKYGELSAIAGNEATYTIPLADSLRGFPLRDANDDSIDRLLADGLKEYLDFAGRFDENTQSYPYAGALLEPFAMASTMINFMPPKEKAQLREKLARRLELVNDVKRSYTYPAVDWTEMMRLMPDDAGVTAIYANPDLPRKKLWNYYVRTERFTQRDYFICYLNLCLFTVEKVLNTGTPEEISRVVFPLIENDWGAGLTFYYMYLAMLATGSSRDIQANWENIKKMNSFFELFHDWACMSSGYAENGLGWVEGANYGAFSVFPQLAHAAGDTKAEEFALYLGAKQLALRASQLRAGTEFFHRYMRTEPFRYWKMYRSEPNPAFDFQYIPRMWPNHTTDDALYNGTTEGLYPEYFLDMSRILPGEFKEAVACYKDGLVNYNKKKSWTMIQQVSSVLIAEALDESIPEETVLKDLEFAEKNGMLFHEWRGIHVFSRRLPKNYFESQIRALLAARHQPVTMRRWLHCAVTDAVWDGKRNTAMFVLEKTGDMDGELLLDFKRLPLSVKMDGNDCDVPKTGGLFAIPVKRSATVEVRF